MWENSLKTEWNHWGRAFFKKQEPLKWWKGTRYFEKTQASGWSGEERKMKPDPETDISAKSDGIQD